MWIPDPEESGAVKPELVLGRVDYTREQRLRRQCPPENFFQPELNGPRPARGKNMSKSRSPNALDTEFFRNIGIVLLALTFIAGSATLTLTLRINDSVAPADLMANLDPSGAVE